MKTLKIAVLGGVALSAFSFGAQADDLADLKAQIEALNSRVAQMEAAPQVPQGYSLLTVSEGARVETPGMPMDSKDRASFGETSRVISVLPTADAPATTIITWSGYVRAGLVYNSYDNEWSFRGRGFFGDTYGEWQDVYEGTVSVPGSQIGTDINGDPVFGPATSKRALALGDSAPDIFDPLNYTDDDDDISVPARGALRVTATTDTAVGEVGVDIQFRADYDGNGNSNVYMHKAWGYWAMTPELTFGGGYTGSLGQISYGYDGACSCYYTDNAGVDFDPGDTSQLRLTYESGPFSMAVALEDGTIQGESRQGGADINADSLGVAGEIKYAGDMFSGEVAGVWRDGKEGREDLWQVGAGVGFGLTDFAVLTFAGAVGSGPYQGIDDGEVISVGSGLIGQDWWGVSTLVQFNIAEQWSLELAAGYKERESNSFTGSSSALLVHPGGPVTIGTLGSNGVDQERFAVMGGLYYSPVSQLTLGIEGEWYTVENDFNAISYDTVAGEVPDHGVEFAVSNDYDAMTVDFVANWNF